jgi:hypothetical protein
VRRKDEKRVALSEPTPIAGLDIRDPRDLLSQQQKEELKHTLEEDARARREAEASTVRFRLS